MANEIGGKGNVLIVEGIPGASASDSQNYACLSAEEVPRRERGGPDRRHVDRSGRAGGDPKWLATNPGQLDGIIIQSASELGAIRAMKQSGREMVPITIGSELGALCFWRNNPDVVSSAIHALAAGDDFEMIWNIMMRTLQGQGPKIQSILTTPLPMSKDEMMARSRRLQRGQRPVVSSGHRGLGGQGLSGPVLPAPRRSRSLRPGVAPQALIKRPDCSPGPPAAAPPRGSPNPPQPCRNPANAARVGRNIEGTQDLRATVALPRCRCGPMRGEVHAIIGGNRQRQSTLAKVISGVLIPDSGPGVHSGESRHTPHEARELGISNVFQEVLRGRRMFGLRQLFLAGRMACWGLRRRANPVRAGVGADGRNCLGLTST